MLGLSPYIDIDEKCRLKSNQTTRISDAVSDAG